MLRQTFTNYEYIIKDGGSKDNTLEIVKEYTPQFGDRLKIVSAPDKGIYDAMNIGLQMATGDVVGILNSDDFSLRMMRCRRSPMHLSRMISMQRMGISIL